MEPDINKVIDNVYSNVKKRFLVVEDNVYHAERLFMAKQIIIDVVNKKFKGEYNDSQASRILSVMENYLKGEVELIRDNGEIKIAMKDKREEERQKAIDSLRTAYQNMVDKLINNENKERGE